MSIESWLNKPNLKINVVALIGGQYLARYVPDSGLTIDPKYLLIDKVNFAKAVIDLRDIKTSIPTDSLTLLDKDFVATEFLLTATNRYLNTEALLYIGLSDVNYPWSQYLLVSRAIIKDITRTINGYNISLRRNVALTSRPIWYVFDGLAKDVTEFDSTIALNSSIFFPSPSGMIKIDDEVMTYSGNDTATGILSGVVRGLYGSENDSTKVTVRADSNNNLDGKYFLINTPTQSYAIWYKTISGAAPPSYPLNIEVDILTNANANEVSLATMNAVNNSSAFTATSSGERVIITSIPPGQTSPAQDFNSGFLFESINLSIEDHRKGTEVISIRLLEENPITALLQLMISNGGGGAYDVLPYGLGINPNQIDVTGIEAIRDTFHPNDVYRFFINQVSSGQEFFEDVICLPTNTRLTNDNGLITLVYIDQTTVYDFLADESNIIGIPDWSVSVDKVINRIAINFNYNVALDTYGKTLVFENAQSITDYGLKESIFDFKGIYSDLNGDDIIIELAQKLLIRLKDPRTKITANTFFSSMNVKLGDTVKLRHRFVPGNTTMGADTDMTVLEKSVDFSKGTVSLGLYYTTISISGVKRFGVISPYSPIISIVSQRTFDVADGTWYGVGYKIKIGNETRTILLVTGDTLTVDAPFDVALNIGDFIKMVDYDSASSAQKDRYAFVSPNAGNFSDGGLAYQIVP